MTETDKDDLVVRLRLGGKVRADGGYSIPSEQETMQEAADEIERLRLQLARVEAAYQDLAALMGCYANAMSAEEILAIAANMVGKLMAMQDQRTMTRERAFEIVAKNIETGNAQAVETTANPR